MLDAIVQLIRNFLCCLKDLNVLPESFLHVPIVSFLKSSFNYDVKIPAPLHLTTVLEFFICFTQFYAHYSSTKGGFKMIQSGYNKFQYLQYLTKVRKSQKQTSSNKSSKAEEIMDKKLASDKDSAFKSIIIGVCVLPIGIAFFWLFANSLHVTSTDWVGGLPALMFALAVMEVALVPLLYYMIIDGSDKISNSQAMKTLALKSLEETDIDLKIFGFLIIDYNPFWSEEKESSKDSKFLQQQFNKEIKNIQTRLTAFFTSKDKQIESISSDLSRQSSESKMEGYREYVYFILNALAFYGYFLGIVVYLWEEQHEPTYINQIKLGMTHQDADWRGNFLGDFMWTIEPLIILFSPFLMKRFLPSNDKMKKE